MLRSGFANTFSDYATQVFLPYITSQLQHVNRLDVVWDEYIADSLKAETRTRRGKGIRRRVEPSNSIPGNWQEFLRINDNKTELFSFLATRAATIATDKHVVSIYHIDVLGMYSVCLHALVKVQDVLRDGFEISIQYGGHAHSGQGRGSPAHLH